MSNDPVKASAAKFNRPKAVIISILVCAALGAGTLAIAGTPNLPFFWLVFLFEAIVAVVCIYALDPALLNERMKPQGKDEDKLGRPLVSVLYLFSLIIPALDVGRWHISDSVPFAMQMFGVPLNIVGWAGVFWAMRTNMYFSSAIRLQPDRDQHVITTGPYRFIRHPGYSFAALGFIGQSMMLGSWLGFIPVTLLLIDFVYRSFLEEKILVDGLPGYKTYMDRVKSRWVPGLF